MDSDDAILLPTSASATIAMGVASLALRKRKDKAARSKRNPNQADSRSERSSHGGDDFAGDMQPPVTARDLP